MIKTINARILELLLEAGPRGCVSSDIAAATGRTVDNVSMQLGVATQMGLVGWWPEPMGRSTKRRRYWLLEFLPAKKPPAPAGAERHWRKPQPVHKPPPAAPTITSARNYTHDPRYQVAPGAQVFGAGFAALGIGRYLEE